MGKGFREDGRRDAKRLQCRVRMMEMMMQLRNDRKASFETTKLCLYVLHASCPASVHSSLSPLRPQIYREFVDGSGVTDNFLFVFRHRERLQTVTRPRNWTRCLRTIPAQVRPWRRCGSMDARGGEVSTWAGRCRASVQALRDSLEPLIQPRVGSSWANPRGDMGRQRPGKLEFMGMQWEGPPAAVEEESV